MCNFFKDIMNGAILACYIKNSYMVPKDGQIVARHDKLHLCGVFYNNMNCSTETCIKAPVPYPFLGTKDFRKFSRQYTRHEDLFAKQKRRQQISRSIAKLYNLQIITACLCFCKIFNNT